MSDAVAAETKVSTKRALVLVGTAKARDGYDLTIVAEGRSYDADGVSSAVLAGYAKGADLYFRITPEVSFPKDSPVLTLGVDVRQNGFTGFTPVAGEINVGPAHPAFAAANLAYQHGAGKIDIAGLTAAEKERLKPFVDALPTHAAEPAQVAVSFL